GSRRAKPSGRPNDGTGNWTFGQFPGASSKHVLRSPDTKRRRGTVLTARTLRITAAIAAIFLLGGLVSVATARRAAETKGTIQGAGGEYFGYVKSQRLKCKNGRKVKLFKQLGSRPHPRTDKFIKSDIAHANGKRSQWHTARD